MKNLLVFLVFTQLAFSQKYFTRTGVTSFEASLEAFEPVEAKNKSTSVILTKDGQIASQLFINAFDFKVALMQEHFNESYMESEDFPKAVFIGKIDDFNINTINEKNTYTVSGKLTIKEITQNISFPAKIVLQENKILYFEGNFKVSLAAYKIKIPSIVRKKIAKEVSIDLDYELTEKL